MKTLTKYYIERTFLEGFIVKYWRERDKTDNIMGKTNSNSKRDKIKQSYHSGMYNMYKFLDEKLNISYKENLIEVKYNTSNTENGIGHMKGVLLYEENGMKVYENKENPDHFFQIYEEENGYIKKIHFNEL